MREKSIQSLRSGVRLLASGVGLAAAIYGSYAAITWYRYGHVARSAPPSKDVDSLLDRFIPTYEVVERHHVRIAAPAEITFSAACSMNLEKSAVVRSIFKSRALILGGRLESRSAPLGLAAQARAWGWGVLAEVPGREIVFGVATQPWLANPVFSALPPEAFETFNEPGYVKIAWTLRADPMGATNSMFRTETRVTATDPTSRAKFRKYWALLSPGIILIRRLSLTPLKKEAERQAHQASLDDRNNL